MKFAIWYFTWVLIAFSLVMATSCTSEAAIPGELESAINKYCDSRGTTPVPPPTPPVPPPTPSPPSWEKVVDYGDAGYKETGDAWADYKYPASHGGSYRYLSHKERGLKRSGTATWTITIPYTGMYEVSTSWRPSENRTNDADYLVTKSDGGQEKYTFSQRGTGGSHRQVFRNFWYAQGQVVSVTLDGTDDNQSDCADAAYWKLVK